MPTEASDSELVEASSSGLLFASSGSPPLASALEWPSGNEGISRSSSYLTLADDMRNGTTQPTNARAIVPYVRPQARLEPWCLQNTDRLSAALDALRCTSKISLLDIFMRAGCSNALRACCCLPAGCSVVVGVRSSSLAYRADGREGELDAPSCEGGCMSVLLACWLQLIL